MSARAWPWAPEIKQALRETRTALPHRKLNCRQDWAAPWREWERAPWSYSTSPQCLVRKVLSRLKKKVEKQKKKGKDAEREGG